MIELKNEALDKYTTVKIGGTAETMYLPQNVEDLKYLYEKKKLHHILSGGSNLLINDKSFDCVVNLREMNDSFVSLGDGVFEVGASVRLQKLINEINLNGYGGIEYLYSVPGLVGGAVVMNAGRGRGAGQCISDHILSVKVFREGEIVELKKEECGFDYRKSVFKTDGSIVYSVVFRFLPMGEEESTKAKKDRIEKCKIKQDNSHPNFGSVFSVYNPRLMRWVKKRETGTKHVHFSSKTTNWLLNDGSGSFDEAKKAIKKVERMHRFFRKKIERELIVWE